MTSRLLIPGRHPAVPIEIGAPRQIRIGRPVQAPRNQLWSKQHSANTRTTSSGFTPPSFGGRSSTAPQTPIAGDPGATAWPTDRSSSQPLGRNPIPSDDSPTAGPYLANHRAALTNCRLSIPEHGLAMSLDRGLRSNDGDWSAARLTSQIGSIVGESSDGIGLRPSGCELVRSVGQK